MTMKTVDRPERKALLARATAGVAALIVITTTLATIRLVPAESMARLQLAPWIAAACALACAMLILWWTRLRGYFARSPLVLSRVVLFTLEALAVSATPNITVIVAARIMQSIAAATSRQGGTLVPLPALADHVRRVAPLSGAATSTTDACVPATRNPLIIYPQRCSVFLGSSSSLIVETVGRLTRVSPQTRRKWRTLD